MEYTDEYLRDPEIWRDYLCQYFNSDPKTFSDWADVAHEAARIRGYEDWSEEWDFSGAICGASWDLAIKRVAVAAGVDAQLLDEVLDPDYVGVPAGAGWPAILEAIEKQKLQNEKDGTGTGTQ